MSPQMAQELGLAERDPDYLNPYAKKPNPAPKKETLKKKKPKKSFRRGPVLSRGEL